MPKRWQYVSPMTERPATRRMTLVAGVTSLVGPTCAALREANHLPRLDPYLEVWLLAAIGAFGVGIGVLSICRGAKVAGIVCFLTNAAVLGLYGFIAVFFALGGNR